MMKNAVNRNRTGRLRLGIDVGSTTVKVALVDVARNELMFSCYTRHQADIVKACKRVIAAVHEAAGDVEVSCAVCGSGGRPIANALRVPYVQEVVASTVAISHLFPETKTLIELGGQDAKVVFFGKDAKSGKLQATDMRMNGSCAGGTGAFIDEIAKLLDAGENGLEALASHGSRVYEVSGRCGVFAKTDIQPLLIQGVPREDLALSTFHAIAKQTIGGLAQGLELAAPVAFAGGPLTYCPTLVSVFKERLGLDDAEAIVPDNAEVLVAFGCALAVDELPNVRDAGPFDFDNALKMLESHLLVQGKAEKHACAAPPLFETSLEREQFETRHNSRLQKASFPGTANDGNRRQRCEDGLLPLDVYVGVDSGSTTTKVAALDASGNVVALRYTHNDGDPISAAKQELLSIRSEALKQGLTLRVLGFGTTGYGERMLSSALGADASTVETVAHAKGCSKFIPDATFILDIGGQDMKAIWLDDGVITNVMLNEACSSGCGSFLENFADNLGIPVEEIATYAFSSKEPAELGSRCTVFMTSTIINEQRNGKCESDIMAGLCRSIIENVFTKVVRLANTDELGDKIVVQGGTFRNLAVLRALEEHLGHEVTRAPYPGEMGAIGAALYAKETMEQSASSASPARKRSSFIGFKALHQLSWDTESGITCEGCANSCARTVTSFNTGEHFVIGNRCSRGETLGILPLSQDAAIPPKSTNSKSATDLFEIRRRLLFSDYPCTPVREHQKERIGIPRVLEFWDSMPFWTTFLQALGHEVVLSRPTSQQSFERGLQFVASDTICLPAKIVHGHVLDLCDRRVDRILFPHVMHLPPEGTDKSSPYTCAIVMGYPMVVRNFQDPERSFSIKFDTPVFHWFSDKNRKDQICAWARDSLGATRKEAVAAFEQGEQAIRRFRDDLAKAGTKVLDTAKARGEKAVVLAGRPYHTDPFVSHGISRMFTDAGISVLTADSLPHQHEIPLDNLLPEVTNNFHTRMLESALFAANDPTLEYAQIVSFGCGHDAILSDEIARILETVGSKHPLILKVDESEAQGSIAIRVRSFIETMQR